MRIFLWENDVDAAWAEARAGGCAQDLRLDLAARREKDDPEDVVIVYQAQLEPALDRRENETYREAKALLRTVRGLLIVARDQVDLDESLQYAYGDSETCWSYRQLQGH